MKKKTHCNWEDTLNKCLYFHQGNGDGILKLQENKYEIDL